MVGLFIANRYELLEKIGEGGMAEVYKAKCHKLGRFVAVKILKKEFNNDEEFVEKFKNEARSAGSLSNNNIVNVYDVGTENNINYIIMELVDGKTLKDIIEEEKKLNIDAAIIIAIQIARALQAAHQSNIIHRDIKPQNILVTKDGIVKVADFGIAKATNSVTIVNTRRIIGSANYFSPEQAKGNIVDCRADIYSLGIVLYEMVTGKLPFEAESPVTVALKHIQEEVVPPKKINTEIPDSFNQLILKAIEKEPRNRYQSSKDMLKDLQEIKNNKNYFISSYSGDYDSTRIMEPIIIENTDDTETTALKSDKNKKNKKKTGMIVAIMLVVIVVGVGLGAISVRYFYNRNKASSEVTVPNIVGMTEEQGKRLLEQYNLKLSIIGTEEDSTPKGTIIRSYPKEGSVVKPDREIQVLISLGPRQIKVPQLVDMDLTSAQNILRSQNIKIGNIEYEYNEDKEINTVMDQQPEANALINTDEEVNIIVSRGPEIILVKVPNLVGKTLNEAENLLKSQELKLGDKTQVFTSDPELKSLDGTIKIQSIQKDTEVKEGEIIDVTYYVYEEPKVETVKVPDFVNYRVAEAKEIANENNLKVEIKGNYQDDYIVTNQNINKNEEVEINSVIILEAKKPEKEENKLQQ